MVDTGIGADKTKFMFDDDCAGTSPHNRFAFPQYELSKSRIFFCLRGKFNRIRTWYHSCEINQASFGFADHFLGEDENIIVFQRDV